MIELKDLLNRFEKILNHEAVKVSLIQGVVKDLVHIDLNKNNIRVKNTVIYLDIKPIYKNEILFKKDIIITFLNKEGLKIEDIR